MSYTPGVGGDPAQLAQRISSNIQNITQCCELSFKLTSLFLFNSFFFFFDGKKKSIYLVSDVCGTSLFYFIFFIYFY